jgi:STE24 endopeptidase
VFVVGALAFGVLAWLLVPWQWVPGGHYTHVTPADVFTPAQIARAERYSSLQRHLGWAGLAVSLVVALAIGLTPLGRALVQRIPGPWWVRVPLAAFVVLGIGTMATVWFGARIQRNELSFGLSRQAWPGWWHDQIVGLAVTWAGTSIALLVFVALARRLPRSWPLAVAIAAVALSFAGSFIYPVVVEPLFNSFTPMRSGTLRDQIMALAAREQVRISDVLVADASRRTTTLNAYVSGFGDSRRVVVYDNLIKDLPRDEALVVIAHELGHARHRDVLLGTTLGAAGGVAGVGLLGLLLGWPDLLRRSRVASPADPVVVPLVLALVAVGTLLVSPLENTISRAIEARADRAALEATHDVDAFDAVQRRLATSALADPIPPPWSQIWFGTHPTALQRIGIAAALRPSLVSSSRR